MENYKCQCSCSKIIFYIPQKPKEIAQCHCTTCKKLHQGKFASFSKYNKKSVILDFANMSFIESSERAKRYRCNDCNDWICMIYNNSDNIWIETDRFAFSCSDIEKYNIYR